jgi:transposase
VSGVPNVPSAEELAELPHDELAARLADAYRLTGELTVRLERLERRTGRESSTSPEPLSPDSPYKRKGPRDRSLRERGKRAPGKQPGEPGTTMRLADDPDYRFWYPPAGCRKCGTGLAVRGPLCRPRDYADLGKGVAGLDADSSAEIGIIAVSPRRPTAPTWSVRSEPKAMSHVR